MGLRPTNSDENHVGRASTPAAGLQTRLFPNRLCWFFDCARVLQDPLFAQQNRRAWTPAAGLEARPTINAGVRLREKYAALGVGARPTWTEVQRRYLPKIMASRFSIREVSTSNTTAHASTDTPASAYRATLGGLPPNTSAASAY